METLTLPDQLRGDTFKGRDIQIKINNVAKDLTNTRIRIEFRKQKKSGTVEKTITHEDGIDKFDAVNGWFRIKKFIADFPVGDIYWDCELTDPSEVDGEADDVNTYFGGVWKITEDVTQSPA